MNNMDKARAIIDRLEYEGEVLSSEALYIVADALDEIDAANDPYMPTPEEWAANPWATASTTDADGYLSLYEQPPAAGVDGWMGGGMSTGPIRYTTPPDWRVTLRTRPSHL